MDTNPLLERIKNAKDPAELDALAGHISKIKEGRDSSWKDLMYTLPSGFERATVGGAASIAELPEIATYFGKKFFDQAPGGKQIEAAKANPSSINPSLPADESVTANPQAKPTYPNAPPGTLYNTIQNAVQDKFGPLYEPQHFPGKLADTAMSYGAMATPGGLARLPARMAAAGGAALLGEGSGEALRDTGFSNLAPYGEAVGTGVGALLGHRITAPFPAQNMANLQLAKTLTDEGVRVPVGKKTTSPTLLAWGKAWGRGEVDPADVTRALLNRAGQSPPAGTDMGTFLASKFGPGNEVDQTVNRLSGAARSRFIAVDPTTGRALRDPSGNLMPDTNLERGLQSILSDYQSAGGRLRGNSPTTPMSPIEQEMTNIFGGTSALGPAGAPTSMSGDTYQQTMAHLDQMRTSMHNADPRSADAIQRLQALLTDNMVRTSPNGQDFVTALRNQREGRILLNANANSQGMPANVLSPRAVVNAAGNNTDTDAYRIANAADRLGNVTTDKTSNMPKWLTLLAGAGTAGGLAATGHGTLASVEGGVLPTLLTPYASDVLNPMFGKLGNTKAAQWWLGRQGGYADRALDEAMRSGTNPVLQPPRSMGSYLGADPFGSVMGLDPATAAKLLTLHGVENAAGQQDQ